MFSPQPKDLCPECSEEQRHRWPLTLDDIDKHRWCIPILLFINPQRRTVRNILKGFCPSTCPQRRKKDVPFAVVTDETPLVPGDLGYPSTKEKRGISFTRIIIEGVPITFHDDHCLSIPDEATTT